MKKNIVILTLIIVTKMSFGQIDDNLMGKWKIGKINIVNGHQIIRLEGENDFHGVTNVGYKTLEQIKVDLMKKAEKEMWSNEDKQSNIKAFEELCQGGFLELYISRTTIEAANSKYFTVILKDTADNEIFRETLKSKIPSVPAGNSHYWTNYDRVKIPTRIEGKFYIYVIDKLGGEKNTKYKFEKL
jgi:hypothetical protein